MAEITAATVKALREETGLGMMDCKKALQETAGDVQAAKDLLRKKGMATAEKKAGRTTTEGLVAISANEDSTSAAMVEVLCETDFCARNEEFRDMASELAQMAADGDDGPIEANESMQQRVQDALAKIRENIRYSRGVKLSASKVGAYVHHNGRVGVLVGVNGEASPEVLADLCMHIAFADPLGITENDVPKDLIAREGEIAGAQAAESGKPQNIIDKIVAGKIKKFVADKALLEQVFVKDEKRKVKDILGSAEVVSFARFAVGAGQEP